MYVCRSWSCTEWQEVATEGSLLCTCAPIASSSIPPAPGDYDIGSGQAWHGMWGSRYVCMYVCDRSEADLGPHTATYPIHQSPFCAPLDCLTHSSYSILQMPEGWYVCMYVC